MFSPQGKNVGADEYDAIGNAFSSLLWELPLVQEYKNDLVQPNLPCVSSVPFAQSTSVAIQDAIPDPSSPVNEQQWAKVNKMVAWFFVNL